MVKPKNKIKIGGIIGNPNAPINEVVRHMRQSEMGIINGGLEKIRAVLTPLEFDELRRKVIRKNKLLPYLPRERRRV